MPENRIEIAITARDADFRRSMDQMRKEASETGAHISKAFESASGGAYKLEDALDSLEFQDVAEEAKKTSLAVTKAFDKAGADVKKSFDEASDNQLAESLVKAQAAVSKFSSAARADLAKVGDGLADAKGEVDQLAEGIKQMNFGQAAERAAEFGEKLADAASQAAGVFTEAGDSFREFERNVKAAYATVGEQDVIIAAGKTIKDTFGDKVELDGISEGSAEFRKFGASATEAAQNLQRAAKVAVAESKGIGEVSSLLAEAFSKDAFDAGITEELRSQLGIGGEALKQFGAKVDENNKVLAEGAEAQAAFQQALAAYIDENERYAGVADRVRDSQAKAQAEIDKFNRSVGETTTSIKGFVAEHATPFLEVFNQLPDSVKGGIGAVALFTASLAGPIAQIGQLIATVQLAKGAQGLGGLSKSLTEAASKMTASLGGAAAAATATGTAVAEAGAAGAAGTAALATGAVEAEVAVGALGAEAATAGTVVVSLGAAIAAVGAILIAGAAIINERNKGLIDAEKAEQALIATQSKAILKYKEHIQWTKASAEAIKGEVDALQGNTDKRIALTEAIGLKEQELDNARKSGDNALVFKLENELKALRGYRNDVDAENAALVESDKKRYQAAAEAFQSFKKAVAEGKGGTNQDQANALERLIPNLDGTAIDEAKAQLRQLNEAIVADRIEALQKVAAADAASGDQLKTQARALLNEYEIQGQKRIEIEEQVEAAAQALDEQRAQRRRALAQEELDLRRSALALEAGKADVADAEIHALEGKLEKGENVRAELERELKGRAENAKHLLDAEATLDRIAIKEKAIADAAADPENAGKIQELAAERERQLNEKVAQDKAKVDRQLATEQEAVATKVAAIAKKKADTEKEAAAKKLELESKHANLAIQSFENQRQAQQATFDERRRQYEEEVALGANRTAELAKLDEEEAKARKAAIIEETNLAIDGIKKRAEAEKAGKSAADRDVIDKQAGVDIERARQQAKAETNALVDKSLTLLREQTAEELKQLDILKQKNDEKKKGQAFDLGSTFATGAQSVEDAFGTNSSGIGISRRDRESSEAVTEDGRTQAELERSIARRRGIITSRENAARGADPSDSTFGISRNARTAGGQRDQISDTAPFPPPPDNSNVVAELRGLRSDLAAKGNGKLNPGWEDQLGRSRGGPSLPGLG